MKIKILAVISISLSISCSSKKTDYSTQPIELNPLWEELDNQLKFRFGQHIIFESINALVVDVSKDEGGIWYGLCFFNENGIFGRQIPSSLSVSGCVNLLDIAYLNEKGLPLFSSMDTMNIIKQIRIGAQSASSSYTELPSLYKRGVERRELEQTACNEGLYDLNPIRECYFPLSSYGK